MPMECQSVNAISYNDHRMDMMRRVKANDSALPFGARKQYRHKHVPNPVSKKLYSLKLSQGKTKFPTRQSLRIEEVKGQQFYKSFPLETGPKKKKEGGIKE